MTEVVLTFNERAYRLGCAPGEEERLALLMTQVQARLDTLLATHGPVGNDRLLLMAALELADALLERTAERDAALARMPAPKPRKSSAG